MALTFSRWTVIVTLACAGVGVALLPIPPRTFARSFNAGQPSRVQRVTGQLDRAREALKIAALGDSIIDISRQSPLPAGGKPTILELGSATAEERQAFATSVDAWWPDSGLDSTVAVALLLGGASRDVEWQVRHMLPASGDGRTCVTLVPTQTWKLAAHRPGLRALEFKLSTELGTCLFFASYGRPGPRIEQWLASRGLDFISYFNPSGHTIGQTIDPSDDPPAQYALFEMEWSMYASRPLGIRCLTGGVDECAAGVASTDTATRPVRPGFHTPTVPWRSAFGSLTGSFLADLQREIGTEKFREFWHSPGTVDQAIRQVTGQSLGEWTRHWDTGRRNLFRTGPLPEQRSVLRVAGMATLLLGLAIAFSVRRTVS